MSRRNPGARALADPRYRPRIVRPRKGKGSYRRKTRSGKAASGSFTSAADVAQQLPWDRIPTIAPVSSRRISWS